MDTKYSIKYWQTKSNNTSNNHNTWSHRLHPRNTRMVQIIKIYQCNTQYKLTEAKNHMVIRCWNSIWQNPTSLDDKSLGEISDKRNIYKHHKSNLTTNIKLNGEKLKVIPLKSGTRQGCPLSPCSSTQFLKFWL